ncbi:ER lumen protein-retaining receptor 1 [Echinops telfairi]|uniref:ER lumen protein-retaining receptor 1 n=1 Tax=Echinops telfairi TaxID=9371 RepID=A0AC55DA11_ECHTE|nr:ER lumen protein-retaining receptor 1 [Echinops telfairi]
MASPLNPSPYHATLLLGPPPQLPPIVKESRTGSPPLPPLWTTGISGKSQVLFAVVFTARYLDLFTNYISLYNTCMKVVYIACSFTTVWMIYSKFKATYDGNHDTFRVEFLIVPTAILAFLVNHDFTPLETPPPPPVGAEHSVYPRPSVASLAVSTALAQAPPGLGTGRSLEAPEGAPAFS